MSAGIWWFDNIPGSLLVRRWCNPCDKPVWRGHRHTEAQR